MKELKIKNVTKRLAAAVLSAMMMLSGLAQATPVWAEETENAATEAESVNTESTETESVDADSVATENAYSYEGDGYAVTYKIANSWNDGYTAEVSIKNTGDKKIHNWNLMFSLDGEIANIWNAKISSRNDDGMYTVEGEEYNANIKPNETVTFGFNAASGKVEIPELHFSQSVQVPVKETDFEVDYAVSDDWETGFVGEIGIQNKSAKCLKDWCIAFDWENEIDNIWNAKIVSHEEKHYVISCEEYNRNIDAGQRVQFGFSCSSGKSSSQPENITVTHFADGDGKDEDISDVEEEIDPSEVTEYADIEYQRGNCAESVLDDVQFMNYAPELLDVTWVSSDESVVTNEGHVTRGQEDRTATITAKIQYKGEEYQKEFVLTVKRITDIDVSTLQDYSLSQLDEMNSGDEDYEVDVNDYRYLESIYGTYSDVKVDSYETALVSLYNVKSAIGISNPFDELQIVSVYVDEAGYIFRFNQIYKGVQVQDNHVTVSTDENGKVDFLGSSYFPLSNDINIIPQITREEAVHSVEECGYILLEEVEGIQQELPVVFNEYGIGVLVWNLFCRKQDDSEEGYEVYVDAQTGEALFAYKVSCNLSNPDKETAIGKDMLNNSRIFPVQILHTKDGKKYRLASTNYKVEVYNKNNKNPITKDKNQWKKEEVSAMANMIDISRYYRDTFDRYSYINVQKRLQAGTLLDGTVKVYFDPSIENNATWRKGSILIGEGTGGQSGFKKRSLAAGKDILAHEFTHGIISEDTGMGTTGISGTVNEAYADILACYIDSNWTIGEDIMIDSCLRNIEFPARSDCPTAVDGAFYLSDTSTASDQKKIHKNSTIISHIAYKMEVHFPKNAKKIWYRSLSQGYEKKTDFYDVRKKVLQTAQKLKVSKYEYQQIKKYFNEANINKNNCKKSDAYFKQVSSSEKIILTKKDIEKNIQLTGRVVKADKDFDFSNNMVLDSVTVKNSSGTEIATTDKYGNYLADVKKDDPVIMHFSRDGYIDEALYLVDESIAGQDIRYCDMVELIPEADKGKGKADGYIRDSITGTGIKGLQISVRKGINNIYTDPEATIESKQDGYYVTPELEAGNYCLEISSANEKYMSAYFNIKIFGGMTLKNQNTSVSDSLEDNQMRVVLTWGEKPRDLDSHLIYSLSNGNKGHIYYGERENVFDNVCIAKLDVDDTNGFGPETTTIYDDETGDYMFYVDNYSGERGLGNGNAMVKVYLGNQTVPSYTFTVPDGTGKVWTVFKYNSAVGRLTVVNELGATVRY